MANDRSTAKNSEDSVDPDFEYRVESSIRDLLNALTNFADNGFEDDTPERVARFLIDRFRPAPLPPLTMFEAPSKDMVIVRNIPFASLCAHHLLPFLGTAHVAYIPGATILGLSKIPRLVEHCAKAPTTQEALTAKIADYLMGAKSGDRELNPQGVFVSLSAKHLCLSIRGAKCADADMITCSLRGNIDKTEVLSHISLHGG
jgi:GTP cyclohydrolase I